MILGFRLNDMHLFEVQLTTIDSASNDEIELSRPGFEQIQCVLKAPPNAPRKTELPFAANVVQQAVVRVRRGAFKRTHCLSLVFDRFRYSTGGNAMYNLTPGQCLLKFLRTLICYLGISQVDRGKVS
jgi:hypothetical protein